MSMSYFDFCHLFKGFRDFDRRTPSWLKANTHLEKNHNITSIDNVYKTW